MAIKIIIQDAPPKEIEDARKRMEKRSIKPPKIEKIESPIEKQIKEPPKIEPIQPPVEEVDQEKKVALNEAFSKIWELIEGKAIMSNAERENLIKYFDSYSPKQKEVLDLLWEDVRILTEGSNQINNKEFNDLKEKYMKDLK